MEARRQKCKQTDVRQHVDADKQTEPYNSGQTVSQYVNLKKKSKQATIKICLTQQRLFDHRRAFQKTRSELATRLKVIITN